MEKIKQQIKEALNSSGAFEEIIAEHQINRHVFESYLDERITSMILDKQNQSTSSFTIEPDDIIKCIHEAVIDTSLESLRDKGLIKSTLGDDGDILFSLTDNGEKVAQEIKQSNHN